MRYFLLFLVLMMACFSLPARAEDPVTDEAGRLYRSFGDAVYQIQVIDQTSNRKTTIGSGFQFTVDGLMATNYHVVAEALQRPESNRVEFLHDKGERGVLKVVAVDVVRDLAIVRMDRPGGTFLSLGASQWPKGTKVFALGNPHDIGFTIIEGTFNGLMEESFVDKIHFSGSLNPGMSGGPAIGHDGAVVGINVATAGNQISFLVPVEPLRTLYGSLLKQPPDSDFMTRVNEDVQKQLLASQEHNIALLLKKDWESVAFGPVMVPGHIHDALKCWGGVDHKEKDPYEYYFSMCSAQDRLYLDNEFDTGAIFYRYNYMLGRDRMNLWKFYNFYQDQYGIPGADFENAREGDVTNFDCNSRFVDAAGFRWKSSFCLRQYKKYPALYDMHLYMAMTGEGKRGLTVTLMAQGVSKKNALALTRKFMGEIRPRPAGAKP